MNMKKAIVFFLFAALSVLSGCSIANTTGSTVAVVSTNPRTDGLYSKNAPQFVLGKAVSVYDARIIQTVNAHFGIAIAPSSGLMFAVSTSDSFDPLYDDLKIYGAFVMIQTYTYETREDEYGRTRIKTIPLVVPLRDYQKKTFRVIE